MNRGKRQKAASVWFDFTKYVLVAVIVSGLLVQPTNWRVVVIGTTMGFVSYVLGLIVEPKDKDKEA